MDTIDNAIKQVKASTPVDLSTVWSTERSMVNLKAIVPIALTLSAQTEAFADRLVGPQKLRVVQNVLLDAIDGQIGDPEVQKQLKTFVKDQLPWVLEGAIKALKSDELSKAFATVAKVCCK